MEESQVLRIKQASPLLSPEFGTRHASLLEQKLLPSFRNNGVQSESEGKSSPAQLTIFYAGAINVYDNIPADKAQAIMLLASESSISKPEAIELPKQEMKKPIHPPSLTSPCKLNAEIPIARKLSLQHFLEKRRRRLTSKSPYSPRRAQHKESESIANNDDHDGSNIISQHSVSLPPFPF